MVLGLGIHRLARRRIRSQVIRALWLRRLSAARQCRVASRMMRFDGPVVLEVEVRRSRMTEHALLVPGMQLADARTLRYAAPDFPTAYQVSELIALLGAQ
jgi:D-amino peptidase